MDKLTRDILIPVFGFGIPQRKPYSSKIKSIKDNLIVLDNGLKLPLEKKDKELQVGQKVIVMPTGGNPMILS